MSKTFNMDLVNAAKDIFLNAMAEGKTSKHAVSAAAKSLCIPRRRVAEWEKRFDWEQEAPETRQAMIRRLAKQADISEVVVENAVRIEELEDAGEIPRGTKVKIIMGETTARKVLNAYKKRKYCK